MRREIINGGEKEEKERAGERKKGRKKEWGKERVGEGKSGGKT